MSPLNQINMFIRLIYSLLRISHVLIGLLITIINISQSPHVVQLIKRKYFLNMIHTFLLIKNKFNKKI